MPDFQMRHIRGRPLTGDALKAHVARSYGPRLVRAGLAMQAEVQKASPRRTGTLKRSWATGEPFWYDALRFVVRVGTSVVYARRVNETSKKSAGYIKRGTDAGRPKVLAELKLGAGDFVRGLWSNE